LESENPMVYAEGFIYLPFHDALYFVIVTLMTVGYGDINPTTVLGQIINMTMIVVTLIIVPS
jgi:Ion channel